MRPSKFPSYHPRTSVRLYDEILTVRILNVLGFKGHFRIDFRALKVEITLNEQISIITVHIF